VWYSSGASDWRELEADMLWRPVPVDAPAGYFSQFDGVADQYDGSDVTLNSDHETLSSWYLEGVLHARGFYFAETRPNSLSYFLTSARAPAQLSGYVNMDGGLHRFETSDLGNAVFATYKCPRNTAALVAHPSVAANEILLSPSYSPGSSQQGVLILLADTTQAPPLDTIVPQTCTMHEQERGTLAPVLKTDLLANFYQHDVAMSFDPLPPTVLALTSRSE
jgi:hypothetical protein